MEGRLQHPIEQAAANDGSHPPSERQSIATSKKEQDRANDAEAGPGRGSANEAERPGHAEAERGGHRMQPIVELHIEARDRWAFGDPIANLR